MHQNRIRQAASSLGAATYCIEQSVRYARTRKPFGEELARNQAIQFPLVELASQVEMLRLPIRKTAWEMDRLPHKEVEHTLSDIVAAFPDIVSLTLKGDLVNKSGSTE